MLNKKVLAGSVVLLFFGSAAAAQLGYLSGASTANLWTVDPATCAIRTCTMPSQASRGIEVSHDGGVYMSGWTTNAIFRIDPATCAVTTVCADPTNLVLGAPYDPVVNNEAIGGPGLWVIDGNPVPTSIGPAGNRNTTLVDVNGGKCTVDCWFPNTGPGSVPMAFAVPDPFGCGKFIGVGFSTSDLNVTRFHLGTGTPGTCVTSTVCTMTEPCQYDAFVGEDCAIWAWNSSMTGNVGFTRIDTQTGTCTTCSLGIPHTGNGYAGVWADPPERPGNQAYVAYEDGTIYTVDLNQCAVVTICNSGLTTVTNAHSVEENELTSWLNGPGGTRTFNINFGTVPPNSLYILVPSLVRNCSRPGIAGGFEFWFTPDIYTWLGLSGRLPYVPVGLLPSGGTQVTWALPLIGYNGGYWMALAFDRSGNVFNVSNVIKVCI